MGNPTGLFTIEGREWQGVRFSRTVLSYGSLDMWCSGRRWPAVVMPDIGDIVELGGMRVFSLPAAPIGCSARFFSQSTVDTLTALAVIDDVQDMLR